MILSKDEIILKLLGVELILNAGNLNVLIMNKNFPQILSGQVFVLFVMTIAAAEVAIALAILVKLMKKT